jgi:hypothetical protein
MDIRVSRVTKRSVLVAAVSPLFAGVAPGALADTIKMHGATTVLDVVVNPLRGTF